MPIAVASSFLRFFVASLILATSSVSLAENLEQKTEELEQLRQNIKTIKKELSLEQIRQNTLQRELAKTEKEASRLHQELRRLDNDLRQQQQTKHDLENEIAHLDQTLQSQRQQLAVQIRANYGNSAQSPIKLLLNQEDPTAIDRLLHYHHYVQQAQAHIITKAQYNRTQLSQLEQELQHQTEKLEAIQSAQKQRHQELTAAQQQRSKLLTQSQRRADRQEQKLEQLVEDAQELSELIKRLQAKRRTQPYIPKSKSLAELKGKLLWPIEAPLRHRFGSPRNQTSLTWQGVVLDGKSGQEVQAIAPGRVAFAEWIRGYGLLLIVDHGEGYMSLYGHNQALLKEAGDEVNAGESIATVGNSGGQEIPGLYFEIRKDGKPADPALWCH
ncbi:MAG: peptidoglycan DD-metalloendopeptidase family protein [Gammaproteobacteria bacterium]|nr:peptidoglycan DD-metalloendopeptidase family protein [Gammaproteobacteria bacterium]